MTDSTPSLGPKSTLLANQEPSSDTPNLPQTGAAGPPTSTGSKRKFVYIGLGLAAILAIALGVGLGVGLKKKGSGSDGEKSSGDERKTNLPALELVKGPEGDWKAVLGGLDPEWAPHYAKAAALVKTWTTLEKVNVTTGIGWSQGPCVGNTGTAPGLGSICLQDGPLGIRFAPLVTVFPAALTTAATFNKDLLFLRGQALGREAREKGVNVLLGPCIGPLGLFPEGGRNWESFGADPYLQGVGGRLTVRGIQGEGVIANAKHYVGNEQELFRRRDEGRNAGWGLDGPISSVLGSADLRETWAWPFQEVVEEGVGSIMCAYNSVNGSQSCSNSYLLNEVLKGEMGFQGFVVSDWLAQDTEAEVSANAGLDMTMPGEKHSFTAGDSFFGAELTAAVVKGEVSQARLNDMVLRIVATHFKLSQDSPSYPRPNFSSWFRRSHGPAYVGAGDNAPGQIILPLNANIDVRGNHSSLARQIASEGTVLLRNENSPNSTLGLPLGKKKVLNLALFGSAAGPNPNGPNSCTDRACNRGALGQGWGSGSVDYTRFITPLESIQSRLYAPLSSDPPAGLFDFTLDDTNRDLLRQKAVAMQEVNGTCLVFVTSDSGEGYGSSEGHAGDRNDLELWHGGAEMVLTVATHCRDTVVVIHAVGAVNLEPFEGHPNVTAILHAHLPGQEHGSSLTPLLFGDEEPSGRLPYTIFKKEGDYPRIEKEANGRVPQSDLRGMAAFDYRNVTSEEQEKTVRYPFGFGLDYHPDPITISDVEVKEEFKPIRFWANGGNSSTASPVTIPDRDLRKEPFTAPKGWRFIKNYIYPYLPAAPKREDITTGPSANLTTRALPVKPRKVLEVTATLKNPSSKARMAVPQLYVTFPGGKGRNLRGFEKVRVEAGGEEVVKFGVSEREVSRWNVGRNQWEVREGRYRVEVMMDSLGRGGRKEVEWRGEY
ncbi:hypothetical protein BJ508DRAFT_334700 [Ascobolus immersus RN42]|uniref:beta-glucosidase n=1 Tax=Ascobolus immersus RN42 TaxID=1160509 RepID=A0A3N4HIL4_ASCIM|nr:hypothetical protein BJ508DRAFT_334700 [Ascobolus immersus RN42]